MCSALASEKLILSYNVYLTDFCTRGWKSTYNVGANRRPAFDFRTWAIWPYRLVNVCLLFISYSVLLFNGDFLRLYLEWSLFLCINFLWQYYLLVCLCIDCWRSIVFYSFEGIIVDSLEAKEAISRFVDILPVAHWGL